MPITGSYENKKLSDSDSTSAEAYYIKIPNVGEKINQIHILEKIAEGGMANVYKVWDEELEVVRAIKILKPGFSEESKYRLQTEAKISAHLHHPNIVEIYGVHLWNNIVPYLVMEYIEGYSLKELIEKYKPLPYLFAVAVTYHICLALHFAHTRLYMLYGKEYSGIVHRDIKPGNILISKSGNVKLADFGIARPSDVSLHTIGTKVMGTFSYLSPEQLEGQDLDVRADIYALGCVLYEMVVGQKAFPQKTVAELVGKKSKGEFIPVDLCVDVPKALYSIIHKSMAHQREKRYENAEEFGEALLGFLQKHSAEPPATVIKRFIEEPKSYNSIAFNNTRKKTLIISACALAIVITVSITSLLYYDKFAMLKQYIVTNFNKINYNIANKTPPPASEPLLNPQTNEQISAQTNNTMAVKETLTSQVQQLESEENKYGIRMLKKGQFAQAAKLLETAIAKQTDQKEKNKLNIYLAEAYLKTGKVDKALKLLETHFIDDGYFYLIKGIALMNSQDFFGALEELSKAQNTRSNLEANVREEAVYYWALTLENIAEKKPNIENKQNCRRAWEQFYKAFCENATRSKYCGVVEQKLSRY